MELKDVLQIIALVFTVVSVTTALLVFAHNLRKDRESREEKLRSAAKADQTFYVETTLVLGELKTATSEIKEQLKEQATGHQDLDKRVTILEERIKSIEKVINLYKKED